MVHEKINCPRCRRPIDAVARVCPFCNFEFRLERDSGRAAKIPLPTPDLPPSAPPAPRTQPTVAFRDRLLQNPAVVGLGIALMLMGAFAVGALVNLIGSRGKVARAQEEKPAAVETATPATQRRELLSDLTLVPVAATTGGTGVVTSAPLPNVDTAIPVEAQRTDATALPSSEYSKVLAQTASGSEKQYEAVDPRSLPPGLGALQQPRTAASRSPERTQPAPPPQTADDEPGERTAISKGRRTNPAPLRQPLPKLDDLKQSGTMRLRLTVGSDGRVREVDVLQGLSGATVRVLEAIQKWRFKPATLDGEPVEGTFDVDISFNAN